MGKVYAIPFSEHFLKTTVDIIDNSSLGKNFLIILPNKRFRSEFLKDPRVKFFSIKSSIITYSEIFDLFLEFKDFCNNASETYLDLHSKKALTETEFEIILHSIICKISDAKLFQEQFLKSINFSDLKKAILECYYYEYKIESLSLELRHERFLCEVLNQFRLFSVKRGLITKAESLNNASNALSRLWHNASNKRVFAFLPQSDVNYIKRLLDCIVQDKHSSIFIRIDPKDIGLKSFIPHKYSHSALEFLKRNKILRDEIIDVKSCTSEVSEHNIYVVHSQNQHEEARLISAVTLSKMQNQESPIVIQTESKSLARKIECLLHAQGVVVDNLLKHQIMSSDLIKIVNMAIEYVLNKAFNHDYSLLLDILNHTFSKYKNNPILEELEISYLRALTAKQSLNDYFFTNEERENFHCFIDIEKSLKILSDKLKKTDNLNGFINIHLGVLNLFLSQEKYEEVESLFHSIKEQISDEIKNMQISYTAYIKIFNSALSKVDIKRNKIKKWDVKIVQVKETRNLQFDTLVFAGLNHGIFPKNNIDHNFFSRSTRIIHSLKEKEIELSYCDYDFMNAINNKDVILSWSMIINSSQARRSYWIDELELVSKKKVQDITEEYRQKVNVALRTFHYVPKKSRSYIPKISQRPRTISATGIEKLVRNPYAYYIHYILKLKSCGDIAAESQKRDFGILVHEALNKTLSQNFSKAEEYREFFHTFFSHYINSGGIHQKFFRLWSVRIKSIIKNVFPYLLDDISYHKNEAYGQMILKVGDMDIRVICIADRVQICKNGVLKIIDYKTGYIPTASDVKSGKYPQLIIEKFIARQGELTDIISKNNIDLEYVDVSGKGIFNIIKIDLDNEALFEEYLRNLLTKYLANKTPFTFINSPDADRLSNEVRHFIRF